MKESNKRLMSLDALRGFDMFFIMGGEALVLSVAAMFPGAVADTMAEQMGHKAWHGLAFYDIIFPLFLFLAGLSLPFSMAKQNSMGYSRWKMTRKFLRRGIMLVFLGVLYNGLLQFDFDSLRYASVLGRIGLAWMLASLSYLWLGKRWSAVLAVVILLGYWALLSLVPAPDAPAGASPFSMEGCLVGYVDRLLLPGVLHSGIHDPEGILSTLPAIVTALLGIFTGDYVRSSKCSGYRKVAVMSAAAIGLLAVGYLWDILFPLNKNLWTSSFVCCAAGWSLALFAIFYLVVDVLEWRNWSLFFRVIGVNSITIYLAQQFFDFYRPVNSFFGGLLSLLPGEFYAVGYWVCYIIVCWLLLYFLYRQKIFLKV